MTEALLSFQLHHDHDGVRERTRLEAWTQKPFQPRGLMLWDVDHAQLEMLTIGAHHELLCSFGPLPARWFTAAASFEQVAKAVAEGKEPPSWGSWSAVFPGQLVRLVFDRKLDAPQAVMWGIAL